MSKKKVVKDVKVDVKSVTSIKCVVCGEIKAVRPDVFLQRVKNFGSVERLLQNYKCQRCRNGQVKRGIQCVRCKEIKAVRKDVYLKRIVRAGSEESLIKSYLCRKCRKVVKHEQKKLVRRVNGSNNKAVFS